MITIDHATTSDLDALLPMIASYREFYQQERDAVRERELIAWLIQTGNSSVYLARNEDEAVGFVQLFQTYSTVRLGPSLILEDLFVVPHERRNGIASKLLDRAIEHAREVGASLMFLETATGNLPAQRVYELAGWSRETQFFKYNAPL